LLTGEYGFVIVFSIMNKEKPTQCIPEEQFQMLTTEHSLYGGQQRMGQYLINACMILVDNEIFYMDDDEAARKLFYQRYVIKG